MSEHKLLALTPPEGQNAASLCGEMLGMAVAVCQKHRLHSGIAITAAMNAAINLAMQATHGQPPATRAQLGGEIVAVITDAFRIKAGLPPLTGAMDVSAQTEEAGRRGLQAEPGYDAASAEAVVEAALMELRRNGGTEADVEEARRTALASQEIAAHMNRIAPVLGDREKLVLVALNTVLNVVGGSYDPRDWPVAWAGVFTTLGQMRDEMLSGRSDLTRKPSGQHLH